MNTALLLTVCVLSGVAAIPVKYDAPPGVVAPANNLRGSDAAPGKPTPASDSAAPEFPVAGSGNAVVAAAPAPASAPTKPPFVDERGDRGHFYYSDECEDCFYKAPQCGCKPAVEYFACLTAHCHSSNGTRFNEKCSALSNQCGSELDIDCKGPQTVCESKFNQLPTGGIGLTLDLENTHDDAFCGPTGVCIGDMHMKANIHMGLQDNASAAGAPAAAPPAATWLECGRPKVSKADVNNNSQWDLCRAEVAVVGEALTAACDLPNTWTLDVAKDKKVYCLLTEGPSGSPPKRLTSPAWHYISNAHEDKQKKAANPPAPKPAAKKAPEPSTTKAPKPAAKKAEKKAAKPAEKKAEKPAEGISGKPVRTARQSSTKKDEDESSKLPWMRNKAKDTVTLPEKTEEPARHTNDASGLPWMQSKEPKADASAKTAPKKQAPKKKAPKKEAPKDEEEEIEEEEYAPVAPVEPKDDAKQTEESTEETEPVKDRMAETATGEERREDKVEDEAKGDEAKSEEADEEDEGNPDKEEDDDKTGLRW